MTAGYLLDTNVVSELRKGARADADVQTWFDEHSTDQLWLSVMKIWRSGFSYSHRIMPGCLT